MPDYKQIGQNIKGLRKRSGLTQQQVADFLAIKLRQYQNIESKGKTSMDTLTAIAILFKATMGEIFSENPNIDMGKQRDVHRIPVVNTIPASGFVLSFDDMVAMNYIYSSVNREGIFALQVSGDSMAPRIEDGDLVVLDPEFQYKDNAIYAVVAGNSEATLKTVKRTEGGYWCVPMNTKYNALFVPEDQMIRMYKVLQIIKTVR
jgi:repressor LexA